MYPWTTPDELSLNIKQSGLEEYEAGKLYELLLPSKFFRLTVPPLE
jgi:hypothetical protein